MFVALGPITQIPSLPLLIVVSVVIAEAVHSVGVGSSRTRAGTGTSKRATAAAAPEDKARIITDGKYMLREL